MRPINPSMPIVVYAVGPFGGAIARYLKLLHIDITTFELTGCESTVQLNLPVPGLMVLASWRSVPKLSCSLEELAYRSNIPLIPVFLDSRILRIGPLMVPAHGPCWNCWVRRRLQHTRWPKEQNALMEFYSTNVDSGPEGYLEPFALMGASRICQMIRLLQEPAEYAGAIWQIDMLSFEITVSKLVGIHACSRCGLELNRHACGFDVMKAELSHLWKSEGDM